MAPKKVTKNKKNEEDEEMTAETTDEMMEDVVITSDNEETEKSKTKKTTKSSSSKDKDDKKKTTTKKKDGLFKGLTFYIDVSSSTGNEGSEAITSKLEEDGATVLKRWSEKVTHLVFLKGKAQNYKKASESDKIKIVNPAWVNDCAKQKKVISIESKHKPEEPESGKRKKGDDAASDSKSKTKTKASDKKNTKKDDDEEEESKDDKSKDTDEEKKEDEDEPAKKKTKTTTTKASTSDKSKTTTTGKSTTTTTKKGSDKKDEKKPESKDEKEGEDEEDKKEESKDDKSKGSTKSKASSSKDEKKTTGKSTTTKKDSDKKDEKKTTDKKKTDDKKKKEKKEPAEKKEKKEPKKAPSAYNIFMSEKKKANKELSLTDISQSWKQLSEEEKKPYNEKAAKAKEEFLKLHPEAAKKSTPKKEQEVWDDDEEDEDDYFDNDEADSLDEEGNVMKFDFTGFDVQSPIETIKKPTKGKYIIEMSSVSDDDKFKMIHTMQSRVDNEPEITKNEETGVVKKKLAKRIMNDFSWATPHDKNCDFEDYNGQYFTHLIVPKDEKVRRTLKLLYAIAFGSYIVTVDWFYACEREGKKVDEEPYSVDFSEISAKSRSILQIEEDKKKRKSRKSSSSNDGEDNAETSDSEEKKKGLLLLSGTNIFVASNCKPPAKHLKRLIELLGGKCVNTFRSAHYYIVNEPEIAKSSISCHMVNEKWLLDTISSYQLPSDYTPYEVKPIEESPKVESTPKKKSSTTKKSSEKKETKKDEKKELIAGTENGKKSVLRAKIDMKSLNKTMRDPVLFRSKDKPHPKLGDKYKAYPTYDFVCPVVDSLDGVTHALRTSEYNDRNEQYYWIIDALGIRKPFLYDFSRLNFANTVMSKRKLQKIVDIGVVEGWNDPRFPTVQGLLRRGLTVEALYNFILEQGASRNVVTIQWEKLWAENKKVIDPKVPRYCALEKEGIVKFTMSNGPQTMESKENAKHKKNDSLGKKTTYYTNTIYLDREDAKAIEQNEEITLMDWGNAIVQEIVKDDAGNVVELKGVLHLEGDFKKTKKKLTWLPVNPEVTIDNVQVVYFGNLINKISLSSDDNIEDVVNRNSKTVTTSIGDHNLKTLKKGDIIQLERRGYFICDVPFDGNTLTLFNIPDSVSKATQK